MSEEAPDKEVIAKLRQRMKFACKPCWELKYCPYGPLVEDFPTLPWTLEESRKMNQINIEALKTGKMQGKPFSKEVRKELEDHVKKYQEENYVGEIPTEIKEMVCNVFMHLCPVFFSAEDFAETSTVRRRARYIPFNIKMRVVRRDNYTCQKCGVHLLDNEVEFDHIIPVSKGGSTEEHNIRLTCYDCNREKTNRVEI